jgi:preprotein translocase subunit SecA
MALHDGRLAEMATGEGKTLVAVLPVYLNALSGGGSFVVTTNDYLAARDGETMGQVYRYLGLSVGIVQSYQKGADRRASYDCDVTYVANQELGFDYLRDNLAMSTENVVVKRPYNFCVVDEADSILMDEARTPLIISRKGGAPTDKYLTCAQIAKNLEEKTHYEINLKDQRVELTPKGYKYVEQILGKTLFDLKDPWAFYVINALKAKELYNRDKEYTINNGQVDIIDAFTGRVLEGRRFTDGLQQSIEAKEGLDVSGETQVVAKVTYQNLFRTFPKLSGMTGTAFTEALEFLAVYNLKVLPIPTALPVARRDNQDAVFRTQDGKMKALLKNVLSTNEKGRPILIGTTSVEQSEYLCESLEKIGVKATLLNARPEIVEKEAQIVAQAGRLGAVTVATNMAGRGTDIILGGNSKELSKVLAKNFLMVSLGLTDPVPTEETASGGAVDAVDVVADGSAATERSDDEIETDPDVLALPSAMALSKHLELWMPQQLSNKAELAMKRAVVSCADLIRESNDNTIDLSDVDKRGKIKLDIEDIVSRAADNRAGIDPKTEFAIKLMRTAIESARAEFEETVQLEAAKVKRLGGLYVVGTSRHESRRIDNQLRGRSGRQGDPGGTRFFLSLEDDIFKIFGGDKMTNLLENFRVADDMPIESDMVVQALDKVQQQVEGYYQGNRQQVYRLDEVAGQHRERIYKFRDTILNSIDVDMTATFADYSKKTLKEIYDAALVPDGKGVKVQGGEVDVEKLGSKCLQFFPNMQLSMEELNKVAMSNPEGVFDFVSAKLDDALVDKSKLLDSFSQWALPSFARYLSMVQIDESWCKHLCRLDLLKEEMVLQSFTAEKDVMETYKESADQLFSTLMDDVRRNTVYSLFIYNPNKENKN